VPKEVTVRDVARHAGVSSGTVSRVLNNREDVAGDLRDRVLRSVADLGYESSRAGRGSAAASAPFEVGFLLALPHVRGTRDLMAPFWARILHGAEAEARRHGARVSYRSLLEADLASHSVSRHLREMRLDGALLVGVATPDMLAAVGSAGLPAVVVEDRPESTGVDAVVSDYASAGRMVVETLLGAGHRDIAFIGGELLPGAGVRNAVWAIEARAIGYRNALAYAGLPLADQLLESCDLTPAGGYAAANRLLARAPQVTAIFCANDPTASGVMQALRDAGRKIPVDISVVGCDDEYGGQTFPPLTTVRVHKELLGVTAVRRLLQLAQDGPEGVSLTMMLPVELVERDSVAPPAPAQHAGS
jgi:LacI family transcriptional regulator, galactose operon repressor